MHREKERERESLIYIRIDKHSRITLVHTDLNMSGQYFHSLVISCAGNIKIENQFTKRNLKKIYCV